MPENITTVLNLPDADFGSGGFSNPADNRVYILQGEGSDRDRKVSLGDLFDWLVGAKAMTNESPQHRVGDIVFKIEDTRGGKILTAYVMKERTLEKLTVTGGLKADSIEGTNQGQGDTKYLILGNTTVNGDLDVKGKAMLGNSMLVADPDAQTLESRVPIGFGDGYQAGKELVRTDEVKTAKISSPNTTLTVSAVIDALGVKGNVTTDSIAPKTGETINVTGNLSIVGNVSLTSGLSAKSSVSDIYRLPKKEGTTSAGVVPAEINANCYHESSSDYTLSGDVGDIVFVDNTGTAQIKVYTGSKYDGETGEWNRKYCLLNAGCCGQFICTGLSSGKDGSRNYSWSPMFNAVVQVES